VRKGTIPAADPASFLEDQGLLRWSLRVVSVVAVVKMYFFPDLAKKD
jgi:hypothetical protein